MPDLICPVQPIPVVSSGYGPRTNADGSAGFHPGIDLAVPSGTPVLAPGAGTVTNAWPDPNNPAGIHVDLALDDGNATRLLHFSELRCATGEHVAQGQLVGLAGSTGDSTGPHVHWEMYVPAGNLVDPAPYLNVWTPTPIEEDEMFVVNFNVKDPTGKVVGSGSSVGGVLRHTQTNTQPVLDSAGNQVPPYYTDITPEDWAHAWATAAPGGPVDAQTIAAGVTAGIKAL